MPWRGNCETVNDCTLLVRGCPIAASPSALVGKHAGVGPFLVRKGPHKRPWALIYFPKTGYRGVLPRTY